MNKNSQASVFAPDHGESSGPQNNNVQNMTYDANGDSPEQQEEEKRTLYQHMMTGCTRQIDPKLKFMGQQMQNQMQQQLAPNQNSSVQSPYNQSYYNKFNISLQNGINGFGYNLSQATPAPNFSHLQSAQRRQIGQIGPMNSGSQYTSIQASPISSSHRPISFQVLQYIQNQQNQAQQSMQNYILEKNDKMQAGVKGAKMISGPSFREIELSQMGFKGQHMRTTRTNNMNLTQPNFSGVMGSMGSQTGIAGVAYSNNSSASKSGIIPNTSFEQSHKNQLMQEAGLLNPANQNRQNGANKVNNLRQQQYVKNQLYQLSTELGAATTNNTTTLGTNGTVSGKLGDEAKERFNTAEHGQESSEPPGGQKGLHATPPVHHQGHHQISHSVDNRNTFKMQDTKSQTFYNYKKQDSLRIAGEQQIQSIVPQLQKMDKQIKLQGVRHNETPQKIQSLQNRHHANNIGTIQNYIMKNQKLIQSNQQDRNDPRQQIFNWQIMGKTPALSSSPGPVQTIGQGLQPILTQDSSQQQALALKAQKRKEGREIRGTINFNNINLNQQQNANSAAKPPQGAASGGSPITGAPVSGLSGSAVAAQRNTLLPPPAGAQLKAEMPSSMLESSQNPQDAGPITGPGDQRYILTLGTMQKNQHDLLRQIEKNQEIIQLQLNHMHKIEQKYHNTPIITKNFQNKIIAQQLVTNNNQITAAGESAIQGLQDEYLANLSQMAMVQQLNAQPLHQDPPDLQPSIQQPSPQASIGTLLPRNPLQPIHTKNPSPSLRNQALANQNAYRMKKRQQLPTGKALAGAVNNQGLYVVANEELEQQNLLNSLVAGAGVGAARGSVGGGEGAKEPLHGEGGGEADGSPAKLNSQLAQYHPMPLVGINAIHQNAQPHAASNPNPAPSPSPPHRNASQLISQANKGKLGSLSGNQRLHLKQNQEKAAILEKQQAHQLSLGMNITTTALQPILHNHSGANQTSQNVQNILNSINHHNKIT